MDDKARRMTFEEASKVFRECFPEPRWTADMFEEKPQQEISVLAFPNVHDEYVYFRMWKTEEWHAVVYHVEFIIEKDAGGRWDLVGKTERAIDATPECQRQFNHWTYYANNHWSSRCPAWNMETLRKDIEALKAAVVVLDGTEAAQDDGTEALQDALPSVGIGCEGVLDLLKRRLAIPDYQRAYCWTEGNVQRLLEDLSKWHEKHEADGKVYHLGSIILKRRKNEAAEVIDGQQRLITLALLAASRTGDLKVDISLGSNNQTTNALEAIKKAHETIRSWREQMDLAQVVVSVVEIGEKESDDLAFNFFNHLNSSGVPLTDYELLKGHHLRYVKEDGVARIMAKRWNALDGGRDDGLKERLLHKCLFRIRKWLAHEWFAWDADERETHDLFHEFTLGFEPLHDLCSNYKEVSIDSILSGGLEFFNYVERHRVLFEQFLKQDSIRAISPLRWRSYGVLHEAIVALAFLFYCKFGDIYLKDAVYAISWNISSLRSKMGQVRRSYLGDKQEFREAAMAISRATHESEALGKLLDKERLAVDENAWGEAGNYWRVLKECARKLEGESTDILNTHYWHAFEFPQNQDQSERGENA